MDDDVVDREVLDSLRAQRSAGEPDLLSELIGLFIGDLGPRMAGLRAAISRRDAGAAARLAHALRGSCGNFGAARMAALCERLERQARSGSIGGAEPMVRQLQVESRRLRHALEAERRKSRAA